MMNAPLILESKCVLCGLCMTKKTTHNLVQNFEMKNLQCLNLNLFMQSALRPAWQFEKLSQRMRAHFRLMSVMCKCQEG